MVVVVGTWDIQHLFFSFIIEKLLYLFVNLLTFLRHVYANLY